MAKAVKGERLKTRIAEQDLKCTTRCGVSLAYQLQVGSDRLEHDSVWTARFPGESIITCRMHVLRLLADLQTDFLA